ncbi:hypothetical protein [Nonomuraea basaltis]|uniref:hypothetical protein n=1 Tax=Nonomuraea basaltis TaxID=2495887 RepID=UPI00110C629F|nr:hypothetical protein [Nonomuraea basaltis]TMR95587.1 hypothetical protein EJK15_27920 [Nonomuraea basaltis]
MTTQSTLFDLPTPAVHCHRCEKEIPDPGPLETSVMSSAKPRQRDGYMGECLNCNHAVAVEQLRDWASSHKSADDRAKAHAWIDALAATGGTP